MAVTLYGIKNCDTIRKARRWLTDQGIEFSFHDFRSDGLNQNQLSQWVDELGWEVLLNKRSATWRKLPPNMKANIDRKKAINMMLEQPAIIKRPLLELEEKRIIGFSDEIYSSIFK